MRAQRSGVSRLVASRAAIALTVAGAQRVHAAAAARRGHALSGTVVGFETQMLAQLAPLDLGGRRWFGDDAHGVRAFLVRSLRTHRMQ